MDLGQQPDTSGAWLSRLISRSICPVELDVGCNNGSFLLRIARTNPQRLYIGVDVSAELCDKARERCRKAGVTNILVQNAEAQDLLQNCIPADSVDSLHVYFPTPLPRASRLLTGRFFKEASRVVCRGGTVRIITDDEEYGASIVGTYSKSVWSQVPWQAILVGQDANLLVGSDWEMKFRQENKYTYPIQLLRTA